MGSKRISIMVSLALTLVVTASVSVPTASAATPCATQQEVSYQGSRYKASQDGRTVKVSVCLGEDYRAEHGQATADVSYQVYRKAGSRQQIASNSGSVAVDGTARFKGRHSVNLCAGGVSNGKYFVKVQVSWSLANLEDNPVRTDKFRMTGGTFSCG